MKTLRISSPIRDALLTLARAERAYQPGVDSASVVELPKLALADAVVAEVRGRLARLPRPQAVRAFLPARKARRRA